MFGGFSRHFRHVIKSKSDEPRGELSLLKLSRGEDALQREQKSDEARAKQQARLIAMPSRGCYFSVS